MMHIFAKPIASIVIAIVLLLVLLLAINRCARNRDQAASARQEAKESGAIAEAARGAVSTVIASQGRENDIDTIVNKAAEEIDHAPDQASARRAALDAVCQLREYAKDSACVVRQADP